MLYISERSPTAKIGAERDNQEKRLAEFVDTKIWRETSREEIGVIDNLHSCTPHLFTSETLVHHDRERLYHTACGDSPSSIRSSEGIEETMRTNLVLSNE